MIAYPHINPEIFRIGPFAVRWYGLMYAIGFASSYFLVQYQLRKQAQGTAGRGLENKGQRAKGKGRDNDEIMPVTPQQFLDSLYTYLILGLVVGARLGYVLFYDLSSYMKQPLEIFAVWHGGMSFHGGAIGTLAAGYWCCRKYGVDFWRAADLVIVTAPIGLGLGRLGNFINGELYGRVTDVPWGMVFPSGGPFPRHPSQLYECLLEGVLLFTILWLLKDRKLAQGSLVALFLVLYGLFRFIVEFFREPDVQLGFIAGPFTMGQVLSVLTALAGVVFFFLLRRRGAQEKR
jgi:phosphatidylglycerol:prolipoprotein diacylglycerol transferase